MVIIFIDTSFQRFEKIYMNQNSHSHIDDHAFAAGTNSFNSYLQKSHTTHRDCRGKNFLPKNKNDTSYPPGLGICAASARFHCKVEQFLHPHK